MRPKFNDNLVAHSVPRIKQIGRSDGRANLRSAPASPEVHPVFGPRLRYRRLSPIGCASETPLRGLQ